ncbi:hypothetical protein LBMAG40_13890 [Cyanobium sp.]|nr:hypothetical protein LBMAG40_13890 [Cyanobium sp.]
MRTATDRLLRLPEVIHLVGLSRTTIYNLIASGEFPRQIVIGPRAVAWYQQELEAWITSKRQVACSAGGSPTITEHRSQLIEDRSGELPGSFLPLHFQGDPIRVRLDFRNVAWFVATDIGRALALQPLSKMLTGIREDERSFHSHEGAGSTGLTLALISEAGLLRLLRGGQRPEARRMQRWLLQEVLPWLHR